MIVLDEIDAAEREAIDEIAKAGGRKPLRLDRRAGQRPLGGADAHPQALDAGGRTAEGRGEIQRQLGVLQRDVFMQRAVAEQDVEKLARLAADRLRRQRDADAI